MKPVTRPIAVLCAFVLLALLVAAPVAAETKKVTSVEGITEFTLDNGMQVLLFPDPSKPTVTVNVTYFVGSRHEGRGEKGMAHLLEHMVFKGTPTHDDIWALLEDHGARFNGTTWVDRTNYFETLPSEPGNLEWALTMEADRMINSFISADDLATEFTVVRNEFERGENDPTSVLWKSMVSSAFVWHNYGDSTIGNRSDIERVPIENLQAFYRKYYQPDNAMLVVAGDFDPKEALPLVEKSFGAIPRPQRTLESSYTIEPVQDGARHVEIKRVGDVAAVGAVYHIPAAAHEDYAALDVLETVLTDRPAGRLYKNLVESGLASSMFGVAFGWHDPGVMIAVAQVPTDKEPQGTLDKMLETMEGLGKNEISEEEVDRARRSILKNIELGLKNSGRIGVQLSEWAAAGDWRLMFLHRDRVEKVTTQQVRDVAARYFVESNRTSGMFLPQQADQILRAEVPQTPDIAALLDGYTGGEAIAEGESFDASPENIESRLTRKKLNNGMQLAMLPKETRGDAVRATLTLRFGTETDVKGRTTAIGMIPGMLMRGSKKHDFQALQDKFDELKAQVNMGGGGPNSMNVSISTDRENLVPVIELVHEVLTTPVFPENEFEIIRKARLSGLEEQLSDPQSRAFNFMFRTLNPYPADDVRYVPTPEEQIERLKAVQLADLKKFHQQFYGASDAQMTVIGDFDVAAVESTIAETIGSWKSPKPFQRIVSKYQGVAGKEEIIHTPDKKMAMVACGMNVEMRDDDPAYPALRISNYVLGASAKSRLLERLRQKEGLSYGTSSFFQADSQDRDAIFGGMAIAAPENAKKAHDSLVDEFKKLITEGIGDQELAEAKASYALQIKNQLSNDGTVAGMINEGLYLDRTMEHYKKLYDAIDKLTAADIKKALSQNVDLSKMVRVQAGDIDG